MQNDDIVAILFSTSLTLVIDQTIRPVQTFVQKSFVVKLLEFTIMV